jgi:redox-sensitive bicupin YhaK (pirin superfamily)
MQWLTAGRGIVHCEWSFGQEKAHGLQLWINLAKEDKMQEPSCQEMLADNIPRSSKEGVEVKVIAGEAFGVKVNFICVAQCYLKIKNKLIFDEGN